MLLLKLILVSLEESNLNNGCCEKPEVGLVSNNKRKPKNSSVLLLDILIEAKIQKIILLSYAMYKKA